MPHPGHSTTDGDGGGSLAKYLAGALSFSVLGYDFLKNPQGAILALVYKEIVDLFVGLAAAIGFQLGNLWDLLLNVVIGGAVSAIVSPIETLTGSIEWAILQVQAFATELAAGTGPFGLLVVVGVWGVAGITAVYSLAGLWRGYKWVRTVFL